MAFSDTIIVNLGISRFTVDIRAIRQRASQIKRYLAARDALSVEEKELESNRLQVEIDLLIQERGLTPRPSAPGH